MAASDLYALQAALLLLPEHLGEVRRRAISCTPISVLIGGLLSEDEAGQLFTPGRLSKSENVVSDYQRIAAAIASAASHVLNRSFFIFKKNRFFHLPGRLL
jgi:VanZ family protein